MYSNKIWYIFVIRNWLNIMYCKLRNPFFRSQSIFFLAVSLLTVCGLLCTVPVYPVFTASCIHNRPPLQYVSIFHVLLYWYPLVASYFYKVVWRPCNFTPIHGLTRPVGQLFATRLGGQQFMSRGCTHSHNGTGFLLLAMSRYIGDPDVIDHWPRPRLRADNGKLH